MLSLWSLLRRHGVRAAILVECAALLLILSASVARGQEGGWVKGGWTDDPAVLCVNGHPAKRRPGVIYGGVDVEEDKVRDHIVPLCLGAPDIAANIQYQALEPSYAKDERERHACEAYCANPSPELLARLRAQFHRD